MTTAGSPPNQPGERDRLDGRPVLVAHHQRHYLYHTARAYSEVGRLGAFLTQRYVHNPRRLGLLARFPVNRVSGAAKRLQRYNEPTLADHVVINPASAIQEVVWRGLGARTILRGRASFGELAGRVCVENGWAAHMPCTGALEAFQLCQTSGLPRVLEQYIADRDHGAQLLIDEADKWGIALTEADLKRRGYSPDLLERNSVELELATDIIAGSDFVATSLIRSGVAPHKIHVAPYGVDAIRFTARRRHRSPAERLDVAFVGGDGLRKGLLYLLEAAQQVGSHAVHIHVFDAPDLPPRLLDAYREFVTFHGHVPPDQLVAGLQRCHIGCLPSLSEGSALSVYEMLATGLPTIVTPNAGAVVRDGLDGFVVPIRDSSALADAVIRLMDEELRQVMADNATERASAYSWNRYAAEVTRCLGITG